MRGRIRDVDGCNWRKVRYGDDYAAAMWTRLSQRRICQSPVVLSACRLRRVYSRRFAQKVVAAAWRLYHSADLIGATSTAGMLVRRAFRFRIPRVRRPNSTWNATVTSSWSHKRIRRFRVLLCALRGVVMIPAKVESSWNEHSLRLSLLSSWCRCKITCVQMLMAMSQKSSGVATDQQGA